jgi:hypothetical protein
MANNNRSVVLKFFVNDQVRHQKTVYKHEIVFAVDCYKKLYPPNKYLMYYTLSSKMN